MSGMLLFLALSLLLFPINPFFSVLFVCYIYVSKSFRYKNVMILVFLLFNLRNSINLCQPIESGSVVEINAKSIIVNKNFTNVLVSVNDISQYSLQDKIILYDLQPLIFSPHTVGFSLKNWALSRNICYQTKGIDTYKTSGYGFLNLLSNGGFNRNSTFIQQIRLILFQSNPNDEFDLLISMGLIYLVIIKCIRLCFLKQSNIIYEQFTLCIIFMYLGYHLAWPLSLIRVWVFTMSSYFFKDRIIRFSVNVIVCGFVQPYGLTQLAYILPMILQFSTLFLPLKSRYLQRTITLVIILILFNHSISLIHIILFPIFFVLYRYLIISSFLLMIMPFLNPIYTILFNLTNWIYGWSQSFGILKGSITGFFIIGFILLYHGIHRYRTLDTVILLIYTGIGIPLFSLPFFYTVTMINVGQGDAFLIQTPFNRNVILIDTGPPYQYQSLKTYLDSQMISTINYLVITHDDNDHSGNIENIKEDFRVNEIVFNGKDIITQWLYLDHLEFNQTMTNDNDSSLVYYIQLWNKRFLFLGDLSIQGEYQLIAHYPNLSIDVLKVGHHGSNTSTSYELIKHVKPQIGLISVGTNTYGHPHYEVIQTLNDFYITYFDSLNNGDVKIIVTPFISFILNSNNELFIFK